MSGGRASCEAALIIVEPPGFDDVLGLCHRGELYTFKYSSQWPVFDGVQAIESYSQGLRQHVLAEREISDEPLQSAIFFPQLPERTEFTHAQLRVPLLPSVERGLTHPELPTGGAGGNAGVGLSDRAHDLFL